MPHYLSRLPLLVLLVVLSLTFAHAMDGEEPTFAESVAEFADAADAFRRHCVRVYMRCASADGEMPEPGAFATDIENERPTLLGGYWWSDRHVILEDPVIHDRFVTSVEIGLPFSDKRHPARIAGRFTKIGALLLEALPDADGEPPRGMPFRFADGDPLDASLMAYAWDGDAWVVDAGGSLGSAFVTDDGVLAMETEDSGILVDENDDAVGLVFGGRLALGDYSKSWMGAAARRTPLLTTAEADALGEQLRATLRDAVLETVFRLRVDIDEEDEDLYFHDDQATESEVRAAGIVVGPRHLFVPLPLHAGAIARIEDIRVRLPDGTSLEAEFSGALREYMAVVVATDADLPAGNLPDGFALLNPLVVPDEAFRIGKGEFSRPDSEYFLRAAVDYDLSRRRERFDYDRWLGTFRAYRGDTVVLTRTGEKGGSLAFGLDGRLLAVALTPRADIVDEETRARLSWDGFRPVGRLYSRFHEAEAFDPALVPVDVDEGRRLIDLGVEYQALDANTARLFLAERETRGGEIGMLVTHVYPGLPAERLGIREHDVLLRLRFDGREEPVELKASDDAAPPPSLYDIEDMSAESLQQILSFRPPPWPARENTLSSTLTSAGAGRAAVLEYMREGVLHRVEFVTAYPEPDYRNAKKHRFPGLGLTVKQLTYEAKRFFRRTEPGGVIVSRVEEGGKSSVAGLHTYLIITRVDGAPVRDAEDFEERMRDFEDGTAASVELTVEGFGKTRLVKLEK